LEEERELASSTPGSVGLVGGGEGRDIIHAGGVRIAFP
jgi:hypothetical protein